MDFKMYAIKGSKSVVFKLGKRKHLLMTRRKENFIPQINYEYAVVHKTSFFGTHQLMNKII
jgi:hypothetical protein